VVVGLVRRTGGSGISFARNECGFVIVSLCVQDSSPLACVDLAQAQVQPETVEGRYVMHIRSNTTSEDYKSVLPKTFS
jgi:hypothetical protein